MTSDELNEAVRTICDRDDLEIVGGKCIPYIGWFWRDVDFDRPQAFGIIPPMPDDPCDPGPGFTGFMVADKWGYDLTRTCTPEEWARIRGLIEAAVSNPTRETTQAVWDAIQAIE